VSKVKCFASIADTTSVTDQLTFNIRKNGVALYSTSTDIDSGGGDYVPGFTPVLSVVEGDYLEVWAAAPTTRTVDTSPFTWFSIEVVEGSILDTTSVIRTTGFTGSSGTNGFTGSAGVGFTGSQGIGFTGSQGSIGYTGSASSGGGATFLTVGTRTTAINVGVATSSSLNVVGRAGNVAVNFT
jgi:hypothetical protein